MNRHQKGFTIAEILTTIGLSCLLLIFVPSCDAMPEYLKAKDKAMEAEVKSNCHSIQIALSRYAVDHKGHYPKRIFGGDRQGWNIDGNQKGCLALTEPGEGESRGLPPLDPLIESGYISSYPRNPFIERGKGGLTTINFTGGTAKKGYGDPRFGFSGNAMGNILNDPRYLWEKVDDELVLSDEQYLIYDWEGSREKGISMANPDRDFNPLYSSGRRGASKVWSSGIWPGQFFYRAGGDFIYPDAFNDESTIWDLQYQNIRRYLLGGFGSSRTEGIDVIRATDISGGNANNFKGYIEDFYETHESINGENVRFHLSTPEVFGGGSLNEAPVFPYFTSSEPYEWLYGCPDGFKDGVIISLIPGNDFRLSD